MAPTTRRAPYPPLQQSSSSVSATDDSSSDTEEEEELSPRGAAAQMPPLNPQPHPSSAAADDESEEESDSDADAQACQARLSPRPTSKTAVAAPLSQHSEVAEPVLEEVVAAIAAQQHDDPEADKEDDGLSTEEDPGVPEPVHKKAARAVPQTDETKAVEEAGSLPQKDSEVAEPMPKKAAATRKSKTVKKRPPPEPAPSGRAKKAKAAVATSAGKAKEAVSSPSAKTKNPPGADPEKSELDPSQASKSKKRPRPWSIEDTIKILEAMVVRFRSEKVQPKTEVILAAVGDHLDRKDCVYSDIYEKVRNLRQWYQKTAATGSVPTEADELKKYNLSEELWGKKAKDAIDAAPSVPIHDGAVEVTNRNSDTQKGSEKGKAKDAVDAAASDSAQAKKPKDGAVKVTNQNSDTQEGKAKDAVDAAASVPAQDNKGKGGTVKVTNQNTDTQNGSEKGKAVKVKTGKNEKSKLSKETSVAATLDGDALTKSNGGKMEENEMDINDESLVPNKTSTKSQNGGTQSEEKIHEEETETGVSVQGMHRNLDELHDLYPCLSSCVESIQTNLPPGENVRGAFGFIGDEKARALESKIKAQRVADAMAKVRRGDIKNEVLRLLIGLMD